VTRLEEALNKPRVVLAVEMVAVAVNALFYLGFYLPRMSLPEAIGGSFPKAILVVPSDPPPEFPLPAHLLSLLVVGHEIPPRVCSLQFVGGEQRRGVPILQGAYFAQ
jgi:hypothetical protein